MCNGKLNHMVWALTKLLKELNSQCFTVFSAATQWDPTVQLEKGHHLSQITQNNLQTHGQRDKMKRGSRHYQVGVTLKPQLRVVWTCLWSLKPPPVQYGNALGGICFCFSRVCERQTRGLQQYLNWIEQHSSAEHTSHFRGVTHHSSEQLESLKLSK